MCAEVRVQGRSEMLLPRHLQIRGKELKSRGDSRIFQWGGTRETMWGLANKLIEHLITWFVVIMFLFPNKAFIYSI